MLGRRASARENEGCVLESMDVLKPVHLQPRANCQASKNSCFGRIEEIGRLGSAMIGDFDVTGTARKGLETQPMTATAESFDGIGTATKVLTRPPTIATAGDFDGTGTAQTGRKE